MKKRLLNAAAALLLSVPAGAAGPAAPAKTKAGPQGARPAAQEARPLAGPVQHSIKIGDIAVYTPVTGISTAQDTYDVFAPFDGRVETLQAELFEFVTVKSVLARMVSTEMAALLDSSTPESRKQTERRWQDVYSYTDITPETQGVITNIYIQPKTTVTKGDRLFTVARKVFIIGRNTEPLYSALTTGMTAEVVHVRNPDDTFQTRLTGFIRLKDSPLLNRVWLEVLDLKSGIKIGEQFNGVLTIGKSSGAMIAPRAHIVNSGGKRFLITEITTGLETAEETEILGHTSVYLEPEYPAAEAKDGKTKKVR
ncbi:MAG: hypothetical protein A2X31_11330 [Elusimicrobia bacterium GWB2_63_22]|nr:MAG: hypothetical protein A2X31_11330 [Elusimicrobia bacterium GWB2_63_22]